MQKFLEAALHRSLDTYRTTFFESAAKIKLSEPRPYNIEFG